MALIFVSWSESEIQYSKETVFKVSSSTDNGIGLGLNRERIRDVILVTMWLQGMERWERAHCLLFQRSWIQNTSPISKLTTTHNYNYRQTYMDFWLPRVPSVNRVQRSTCPHTKIPTHRNKKTKAIQKLLIFFFKAVAVWMIVAMV